MGFYDWFPPYLLDSLDFKSQSYTVERTGQKGGEGRGGRNASSAAVLHPLQLCCFPDVEAEIYRR